MSFQCQTLDLHGDGAINVVYQHNPRPKKTLVLLLDHDGCTSVNGQSTVRLNQNLIWHIFDLIIRNGYTDIIVICLSARQCFEMDMTNEKTNENSRPIHVIPIIMEELKRLCSMSPVKCHFIFDTTITADVHNRVIPGYNYATQYRDNMKTLHDEFKVAMTTYFISYITETYNKSRTGHVHIMFADDRGDLLDPVHATINEMKDTLLPTNTSFEVLGVAVHREWSIINESHQKSDDTTYIVHEGDEFVMLLDQQVGHSFKTLRCQEPSKTRNYPIIRGSSNRSFSSTKIWTTLTAKYATTGTFQYYPFEIPHTIKNM